MQEDGDKPSFFTQISEETFDKVLGQDELHFKLKQYLHADLTVL